MTTYPSAHTKLCWGLTSGIVDFEMNTPSRYTLEAPGKSVYSDVFLTAALDTESGVSFISTNTTRSRVGGVQSNVLGHRLLELRTR